VAADIPPHLSLARQLLEKTSPELVPLFKETNILLIEQKTDALAKYIPAPTKTKKPVIQFRKDLKQYKDDFVALSSIIDRTHRPNFDHYMVVLTALSLSNEWAHFIQDKNGSLNDWFHLKINNQQQASCAVYDLQQYVSDIVMLETAYKLDVYFRKNNDLKGSLSVQMALEKMLLDQIFWDYTIARTTENYEYIKPLFVEMRRIRYAANMQELKDCPKESTFHKLNKKIYERAITPIPLDLKKLIQLNLNQ
jgi:hypothetical protein